MRDEFPVVNRAPGKRLSPRPVQEIACSRCPATAAISAMPSRQPAHTVALKFSQRGWRVVGLGKHVCPACVAAEAARRASPPAQRENLQSESTPMAKPAAASLPGPLSTPANENAGPHPTPEASVSITDLYMKLDDAYDRAKRNYKPGYDDERVARELGVSVVLVKSRREQDFGPLVKDTTREDLAAALVGVSMELGGAKSALAELSHTLGEATERLDFLEKRLCEAQSLAVRLGVAPAVKVA